MLFVNSTKVFNKLKEKSPSGKSSGKGIYIAFLVLVIALTIFSPAFLSVTNITNVLRQAVYVSVIVYGAIFVMAMGGIDLSVGSTMAICGLAVGELMLSGVNTPLSILIALILGAAIGFFNGFLIDKIKIAPFIATMATMTITRGVINVVTKGIPQSGLNSENFTVFGQGTIGIIPIPVIIALIIFAIAYFLLNWTRFGRYILSIGSNVEAARLVGINISKMKLLVYSLTGLMSALAGILLTARMESAMPDAGEGYELDVIAAAVIGGTSLDGGKASLVGTAVGALLMAVVRNGLNLLSINTFWHKVVMGVIILIAVSIDRISAQRNKKS